MFNLSVQSSKLMNNNLFCRNREAAKNISFGIKSDNSKMVCLLTGKSVPEDILYSTKYKLAQMFLNHAQYKPSEMLHCLIGNFLLKCQNPEHTLSENNAKILKTLGLVQPDGSVSDTVSSIAKAAIRIKDGEFYLIHPESKCGPGARVLYC